MATFATPPNEADAGADTGADAVSPNDGIDSDEPDSDDAVVVVDSPVRGELSDANREKLSKLRLALMGKTVMTTDPDYTAEARRTDRREKLEKQLRLARQMRAVMEDAADRAEQTENLQERLEIQKQVGPHVCTMVTLTEAIQQKTTLDDYFHLTRLIQKEKQDWERQVAKAHSVILGQLRIMDEVRRNPKRRRTFRDVSMRPVILPPLATEAAVGLEAFATTPPAASLQNEAPTKKPPTATKHQYQQQQQQQQKKHLQMQRTKPNEQQQQQQQKHKQKQKHKQAQQRKQSSSPVLSTSTSVTATSSNARAGATVGGTKRTTTASSSQVSTSASSAKKSRRSNSPSPAKAPPPNEFTGSRSRRRVVPPRRCHDCKSTTTMYRRCQYWFLTGSKCHKTYCHKCLIAKYMEPASDWANGMAKEIPDWQ